MHSTCFKPYFFIVIITLLHTLILSKPTSESDTIGIINGYEVDITQVPYQAITRSALVGDCGAVIISDKALLTAAHCIGKDMKQSVLTEVTKKKIGGKVYEVDKIILHENFNMSIASNDIAILITKDKIKFSDKAQPINIAPVDIDLPAGTECLVSGFGQTQNGRASDSLLAANVTVFDQEVCVENYKDIITYKVTDRNICADGKDPPRSVCYGDSGGPLAAKSYLIGIVSWGFDCAKPNYPAVYTRVSAYNSWIREKLAHV